MGMGIDIDMAHDCCIAPWASLLSGSSCSYGLGFSLRLQTLGSSRGSPLLFLFLEFLLRLVMGRLLNYDCIPTGCFCQGQCVFRFAAFNFFVLGVMGW
jgi:hypothetical protein